MHSPETESPIIPEGSTVSAMVPLSFSHESALLVQRSQPTANIVHPDNIDGVWEDIAAGKYGMIPFENSSTGPVWNHFLRLAEDDVHIVGEVHLQVGICIGGLRGTIIEQAQRVLSHPVGLRQCSDRLAQLGITEENQIIMNATADGARLLAEQPDAATICLASENAIQAYGLEVLERNAANQKDAMNITQFYIVERNGQEQLPDPEKEYHAAIVEPEYDRIGVFNDILGIIRGARTDLVSVHSDRKHRQGGYHFFMEMEAGDDPALFDVMRRKLENCDAVRSIKWLGSWNQRLYSDSIHTIDPPYRGARPQPAISGNRPDMHHPYHALGFTPDNYTGVLFDVTHSMRTSGVNLFAIDSHTLGPKSYGFSVGMDASQTTAARLDILADELETSRILQSVEWRGSSDSRQAVEQMLS